METVDCGPHCTDEDMRQVHRGKVTHTSSHSSFKLDQGIRTLGTEECGVGCLTSPSLPTYSVNNYLLSDFSVTVLVWFLEIVEKTEVALL